MMDYSEDISAIKEHLMAVSDASYIEKMKHFGIVATHAWGIKITPIRHLARIIGKNTPLAHALWKENIHEIKTLAALVAQTKDFTAEDMDRWAQDFYSWDVCDFTCGEFALNPEVAHTRIEPWARDEREFVRRAGFSLIARIAMRDKKCDDDVFLRYLPLIERYATAPRPMVYQAVDWALRQTGKRSLYLHGAAVDTARRMCESDDACVRRVGRMSLRELLSDGVKRRLKA